MKNENKLSDENIFLLKVISVSQKENKKIIEDLIKKNLDWNYLLNNSLKFGVSPFFYKNLNYLKKNIPDNIFSKFKLSYLHSFSSNLKRYNDALPFLKKLNEKNIHAILLKGGALAEIIYKDIALRMMTDIDILLEKNQIQKAEEILKKLGFKQITIYESSLTKELKLHHQISYKKNNTTIELHWDILSSHHKFSVNISEFIKNSKKIFIQKVPCFIFSVENLLQHLCVHLDHHININEFRLSWLVDIAEIVKFHKNEINWDYLKENSIKNKIEKPIFENLFLVKKYFNSYVPDIFFSNFENEKSNFENNFLFFLDNSNGKLIVKKNLSYYKKIKNIKSLKNKLKYIFAISFPGGNFLKKKYKFKKKKFLIYYNFLHILEKAKKIL